MTTKFSSKGFTLIELLVVMAILGILMGLVVPKIGRMMDEAKENKCRNNMKQLQVAVISHASDQGGNLPFAMSHEIYDAPSRLYYENRGWIAWNPPTGEALGKRWTHRVGGKIKNGATEPMENGMEEDFGYGNPALFGIKNGTLYPYLNNSLEHYACPTRKKGTKEIYRTYAMNGFFRSPENPSWWHRSLSKVATTESYDSYIPEGAKLLLFSEINPTVGTYTHSGADAASSGGDKAAPRNQADCCFAPASKTFDTSVDQIYVNHRSGKPGVKAAFAVFLDGHIQKVLSVTPNGMNSVWYYNRGLDPADDQ